MQLQLTRVAISIVNRKKKKVTANVGRRRVGAYRKNQLAFQQAAASHTSPQNEGYEGQGLILENESNH